MAPSRADKTGKSANRVSSGRARPARAPEAADNRLVASAEPDIDNGQPDRRYSFNALIAVGVVGFLIGRLCSR